MARKVVDCRDMPSEKNCTLMISGEDRDEVVRVAVQHAIDDHGHTRSKELEDEIRAHVKDEVAVGA
jgi:predicted small metal-binding protein